MTDSSRLDEKNFGSFKSELITGLCTNASARSTHSSTTILTTKRAIALFKYIFAHLLRLAYIKEVQMGCRKCVTGNGDHCCREKIEDGKRKNKLFYFCLNAIDKNSLGYIFDQCVTQSGLHLAPLCLCVLHYKCLTIWRPLMRRQFLSGKAPNGISTSMYQVFLAVVQEWERKEESVARRSCTSC